MDAIVSASHLQGKLSIDKVAVDSTDVAAKKKGRREIGYDGKTSTLRALKKIHAVVSGDCSLPVNIITGSANELDSRKLFGPMNDISIKNRSSQTKEKETERSFLQT